jgi:hypothetical protein
LPATGGGAPRRASSGAASSAAIALGPGRGAEIAGVDLVELRELGADQLARHE